MDEHNNALAGAGLPTLPASIQMALRGFQDQEEGRRLAGIVVECLQAISRVIDLKALHGLTLAYDYMDALSALDRGYEAATPPRPTDAESIGIGMVVPILSEGRLMSHIVLRPEAVGGLLEDPDQEDFLNALYSLAHECAHVEADACFERAFPRSLIEACHDHPHDAQRWDIILSCWNEFAACWISAQFVGDLTDMLENTFLQHLVTAREAVDQRINEFQTHQDVLRVLADVYAVYGALMKYAAYHLGNILGQGKTVLDFPKTVSALEGHWFRDAFRDMDLLLRQIASELGRWSDKSRFEQIADIADAIIEANALEQIEAACRWDLGDSPA
jgi:hypothetical protein